jgi:hypothetical protein
MPVDGQCLHIGKEARPVEPTIVRPVISCEAPEVDGNTYFFTKPGLLMLEEAGGKCLLPSHADVDKCARADVAVFGCVTTGEVWQFLRLQGQAALVDDRRCYLDNVGLILAAVRAAVSGGGAAS